MNSLHIYHSYLIIIKVWPISLHWSHSQNSGQITLDQLLNNFANRLGRLYFQKRLQYVLQLNEKNVVEGFPVEVIDRHFGPDFFSFSLFLNIPALGVLSWHINLSSLKPSSWWDHTEIEKHAQVVWAVPSLSYLSLSSQPPTCKFVSLQMILVPRCWAILADTKWMKVVPTQNKYGDGLSH